MPARRAHRSEKLLAFQVKKPTGRNAPSSSSEPSTRQYVGFPPVVEMLPCSVLGLEFVILPRAGADRSIPHKSLSKRDPVTRVSFFNQSVLGRNCSPLKLTRTFSPTKPAGCLGKVKVASSTPSRKASRTIRVQNQGTAGRPSLQSPQKCSAPS